ncbi:MAG: gluconeogenesis factor YvcK family protein [Patescibacteria group bacterium]
MVDKKIVCLGGGIGTVNLIIGLKKYFSDITVIVSMADDGGSSGRLRRLYNIAPPGDLVSCMATLAKTDDSYLTKILTYRFAGERYGRDEEIGGQKLGNLIMVAMRDITGSFDKAIALFQKTFNVKGDFFPATTGNVTISAKTIEGKRIFGEEKIDMGRYAGKRILEKVFLEPANAKTSSKVLKSIKEADAIIAGPGDLYTTILPVLIVKDIKEELKKSKALKIFLVNVANKPFETKGYSVNDYITALKRHLGSFPFDKIIANSNFSVGIPKKYKYQYVALTAPKKLNGVKLITSDIVNENFPLYHNSSKLAKTIIENI